MLDLNHTQRIWDDGDGMMEPIRRHIALATLSISDVEYGW
jgi:hypothetical protein